MLPSPSATYLKNPTPIAVNEIEQNVSNEFEDLHSIIRISSLSVQLEQQFKTFFNEQLQNFALATGKILSTADLNKLTNERRPNFQINLFHPLLLQVAGNFKGNMPGIEFSGRNRDDHERATMFNDLNNYILYTGNDIVYEMAKAYIASQIGRISWIKQEHTYDNDDEGMVDIRYYNKFLKFDARVDERRFEHCNFILDETWLYPEELITTYAKKNPKLAAEIDNQAKMLLGTDARSRKLILSWAERLMNLTIDYSGETVGYDSMRVAYDLNGDYHTPDGRFRAIDMYERRMVNKMKIYDRLAGYEYDITDMVKTKDFGRDWFDKDKLQVVTSRMADPEPYIEESAESKIYQTSVIPGMNIKAFDGLQQLQNKNFKFTACLAYDWHPDILQMKSMIDMVKDSVKSYNHRDNTNLTYLMRSAHGGAYIEKKYTRGLEDQMNKSKIAGFTVVGDGAISKKGIMERGVPSVNASVERYQLLKKEEVEQISGVTPNARGLQESAGEPAKLFQSKVLQSEVMQEWASENAQAALLQICKNNLFYIQNFFTEERTFKIMNEQDNPYWLTVNKKIGDEVLNNTTVGKYDVVISKTPYGRMAKEQNKGKMLEMINILATLNPAFVDPKAVIDIYEPKNRQDWLTRIEKIEGITQQQVNAEAAARQLEGQQNKFAAGANKIQTGLGFMQQAQQILNPETGEKTKGKTAA
jgi:hypothetical protein